MSGEIWHRPPLDRGRDDSSPHITLQLRPDSAATGPARWSSHLGRTEAALWRIVPSFWEIKSHRPWRRWPFCPRYDIQRDGKPEWKPRTDISRLFQISTACPDRLSKFLLLNLLPWNAFNLSGGYEGNLSFSYIFKVVFDSIWVCQGNLLR